MVGRLTPGGMRAAPVMMYAGRTRSWRAYLHRFLKSLWMPVLYPVGVAAASCDLEPPPRQMLPVNPTE